LKRFGVFYLGMSKKTFQVAIDGPVAAGKGTVARLLAERLEVLYVDTGAMYRVGALLAKRAGVDWEVEQAIADLVNESQITMRNPEENERDGRQTTVLVNGEDVSWKIRTELIGRGASVVAKHALVRAALVRKQQIIASERDVVMEGRDITYRVLPEAQLKIYLTGDETIRAQRRHQQLLERGTNIDFETVLNDLKERDSLDMSREHDPLKIVEGVWVLDTTDLTIEGVVDLIEERVNQLKG
jgi:CMP/dCMP kinase